MIRAVRKMLDQSLLSDSGGLVAMDPISSADREFRIDLIRTTTFIMCALGIPSFLLYWNLGVYSIAWGIVTAVAFSLLNVWLLPGTRSLRLRAHLSIASLYVLLFCDNIVTGGFDRPNFAWFYVLPMVAAVMLDLRGAWVWLGVTLATFLGFWSLPSFGVILSSSLPTHMEQGQALFSRISAVLALGLVATAFVLINRRAKRELERANMEIALETKYVQLLQDAAVSANEASDFQEAIEQSLERICSVLEWPTGQAYLTDSEGRLFSIASRGISHAPSGADADVLSSAEFSAGEGLPGRALTSRRPEVLPNFRCVSEERAQAAIRLGIRSAVAVPIISDGMVTGMFEFGITEEGVLDDRLRDVLSHVGIQIGRVAERITLEARLRQSQKVEAVGQLAAGMAHEINNPMSFVLSNINHLRGELKAAAKTDGVDQAASSSAEWLELIDDSLVGIERTIAIVGEVKECTESQESGGRLSDLNQIVEDACREVGRLRGARPAIERRFHERMPKIHCLPQQLYRTFVNLLTNAIQASRDEGKVEVVTGVDGSWLWVSVEDNGPGIPEEHREVLFDPFFTTRPVGEGTGLGLYVACEIVATHGGEIRVRSERGVGARFEVRLPTDLSD